MLITERLLLKDASKIREKGCIDLNLLVHSIQDFLDAGFESRPQMQAPDEQGFHHSFHLQVMLT